MPVPLSEEKPTMMNAVMETNEPVRKSLASYRQDLENRVRAMWEDAAMALFWMGLIRADWVALNEAEKCEISRMEVWK